MSWTWYLWWWSQLRFSWAVGYPTTTCQSGALWQTMGVWICRAQLWTVPNWWSAYFLEWLTQRIASGICLPVYPASFGRSLASKWCFNIELSPQFCVWTIQSLETSTWVCPPTWDGKSQTWLMRAFTALGPFRGRKWIGFLSNPGSIHLETYPLIIRCFCKFQENRSLSVLWNYCLALTNVPDCWCTTIVPNYIHG